jgi:conjugative relaxase-like TrwC/TraI family protein
MLSIGKIALGQHRYYERQVAQGWDDYYAGRGEAPGEWVGRGADVLGLRGRVSSEQFSALIAGHDPRQLGVRLRSSERDPKVAALDLTFSAPKSVSVLAAVGPDGLAGELISAHEQALRAALSYLEDGAVQVRRGHDGNFVQAGDGLIAAAYRHRMSRALDPQLHTHVVAANMSRGPDGRFTALHGAPLYRAAKTAGYLYQSHLRALITERTNLRWRPVHKGAAELAGVPQAVLEEFSKRRREMLRESHSGGFGLDSKAAAEKAAIATRDRKRYGVDTHTWREEVSARAAELGLGTRELGELLRAAREAPVRGRPRPALEERTLGDLLVGPHGLTESANSFDESDVLQQLAAAASSGEPVEKIRRRAARVIQREDVLPTLAGAFTTKDLVECERGLIVAALSRADENAGVLDGEAVARALARDRRPLSEEQRAVIQATATGGRGVEMIEALAGTGKTHVASIIGELYERAGFEVVGVAPTGRAVRELSERGVAARTLERLLIDIEQLGHELPARCVLIFDEAGMAPTRSSGRLFEIAQRAGAKVIAIGDPAQLASVQAGGWLGFLSRRLGSLRLSEVMRQRDSSERRALAALRDGRPERYIEWARTRGRIATFSESERAFAQALEEWSEATRSVGRTRAVMIARDNDTRERFNDAARELLRALGLLGEEHDYGPVSIAVGDRVICRRNDSLLDLDNGTRGSVRHADEYRVVIETDSYLVRELPAGYVAEHVEHAYALTGHGMQGATVEQAVVLASPRELTAGWSYTALSRARGTTRLLIREDRHAHDRSELAPGERSPAAQPTALLERVAQRMRERDSEELAIEQLIPPGRADDRELSAARLAASELAPERAAARAEQPLSPTGQQTLEATREELERLRAQRSSLPLRTIERLGDVEARIAELERKRERVALALSDPPQPVTPRRARSRDVHAVERARLCATLSGHDDALLSARAERTSLQRELGDPEQVRSERDGLDRAIRELRGRVDELQRNLPERGRSRQATQTTPELARPPARDLDVRY